MEIDLVLSSGGARGLAHIGVIDELIARGHKITSVSGSSMGALVGGLYALGTLGRFEEWAMSITKMEVIKLADITINSKGLLKGEKVFRRMKKRGFIPNVNIEDLAIPFVANATDMKSGNEVVFSSGNIAKAIRASIAIPGVFTPVELGESLLIDGGVVNPLPISNIVRKSGSVLVAVDVNCNIEYVKSSRKPKKKREYNAVELLVQSFMLMQGRISEKYVGSPAPDLLIPISLNCAQIHEFHKTKELISYGRESCAKALESINL